MRDLFRKVYEEAEDYGLIRILGFALIIVVITCVAKLVDWISK